MGAIAFLPGGQSVFLIGRHCPPVVAGVVLPSGRTTQANAKATTGGQKYIYKKMNYKFEIAQTVPPEWRQRLPSRREAVVLSGDKAINMVDILQKSCQVFPRNMGRGWSLVGVLEHPEVSNVVTVSGVIEQGKTTALVDFGKGAPEHFIRRVGVLITPNDESQRSLVDGLCDEFIETFEKQLFGLCIEEVSSLASSWVPHIVTLAAMMGVGENDLAVTVAVPRVDLAVAQLRGLRPFGWVKNKVIKVVTGAFWKFSGAEMNKTGEVILPRLINSD